ncbi:hypothetical protein LTR94_038019, partial [Friedmanniomyces endolithicus]
AGASGGAEADRRPGDRDRAIEQRGAGHGAIRLCEPGIAHRQAARRRSGAVDPVRAGIRGDTAVDLRRGRCRDDG